MHHFATVELQKLLEKTIDHYREYIDQYEHDQDYAEGCRSDAVLEMMYAINALAPCSTCGLPLDPQDQNNHMGHEDNCPHYGKEMTGDDGCDCEVYYHPDCCPECNDSRGLCEADGLFDLALEPDPDWEDSAEEYDYTASDLAYDVARESGRL